MKLETYIENNRMTDAAFAELVGTTQVTISRYRRNKRFPSPAMIKRIHEVTNGAVTLADWYSLEPAE